MEQYSSSMKNGWEILLGFTLDVDIVNLLTTCQDCYARYHCLMWLMIKRTLILQ